MRFASSILSTDISEATMFYRNKYRIRNRHQLTKFNVITFGYINIATDCFICLRFNTVRQ